MKHWQRLPLGELCTLVKGSSPISKTLSGRYPLVTTGANRNTADSFQFDGEAACIPLISSTGHGHASLNRIHYQSGRFALANLLAAAVVKDPSVLSTRYLVRYLTFSKDRLIVPLMTGTANMSISLDRLSTVPVEFPPLPEQERIVRILDETDELRKLRAQADSRTAALIPALLYEMFGDPQHTRFPVKPLVELVLDQRPITYGILKPGPDIDGGVPYVRVVDIKQDELHVNQLRRTTPEIADQYRRSTLCPGDVLISIRGTVGRNCIVPVDLVGANITQDTARIAPARGLEPMYVAEFLNTAWAQDWMAQRTQGQAVKGINLGDLKKLPVPVPPAKLQRDFVDRAASVRTMQAQQASSGAHLTDLFQSLLHRAFIDEV